MMDQDFADLAERHRRELHVHCYRMLASFDPPSEDETAISIGRLAGHGGLMPLGRPASLVELGRSGTSRR
jgi:hypothetical protein